jgi:hypothetical protein
VSKPVVWNILKALCKSAFWGIFCTVKASNFGRHGNFRPVFQKGLLSLKHILQKSEENKSCRKKLAVQICFRSFFVHVSSKEGTELAKKDPKCPWGPKLGAFTVHDSTTEGTELARKTSNPQ